MISKILGVFVNPAVLLFNIVIGIYKAIVKTYKDNVKFMDRL